MSQTKVSTLDEIIRIYKNSDGKVIGLHSIVIHEDRKQNPNPSPGNITDKRFKRTGKFSHTFTRFNLDMSGSREIVEVLMLGKYDEFIQNIDSTDIIEVVYFGNAETNDLVIDLRPFPTIGDTI